MFTSNPADLPKSKTEEERNNVIQMATKKNTALKNPCLKEQDLSMRCLQNNDYNKDKCEVVFLNYVHCKAFWNRIKKDRRRNGIKPDLPRPEEQGEIKAYYIKKWGINERLNKNSD